MELGRSCVGVGGVNDVLIAAGGERAGCTLKDVEKYNTFTNKWSSFASLCRDRKWPAVYCFVNESSKRLDVLCFCGQSKNRLRSI